MRKTAQKEIDKIIGYVNHYIMKKLLIIIFLFLCSTSYAAKKTTFTNEVFQKAMSEGKVVVVNSYDRQCQICQRQKIILRKARKDFEEFVFLTFEHKRKRSIAKSLNIQWWSTIVYYKNGMEFHRTIGKQKKNQIYSILNSLK